MGSLLDNLNIDQSFRLLIPQKGWPALNEELVGKTRILC